MVTEKRADAEPSGKRKRGIWKWVVAGVILFIVVIFLLIPVYISSAHGRKFIVDKINSSTGGQASMGRFSMGWWSGIRITDFTFRDKEGTTDVKIKEIHTNPSYLSLLSGNIVLGKTTIDEPKVAINLREAEKKEAVEEKSKKKAEEKKQEGLPVKKVDLVVNNGDMRLTKDSAQAVELTNINSTVNLRPPGQETKFSVKSAIMAQGQGSNINAQGNIKPGSGWSFENASGQIIVDTNNLKLASLQPLLALAGVNAQTSGTVTAHINGSIKNGNIENIDGTVKGSDIDVTLPQLKGDRIQTKELTLDTKMQRQGELLDIQQLNAKTDWMNLQATGQMPTDKKGLQQFLLPDSKAGINANFQGNLAMLASQMPNTLGIKEGTKITSGQMDGTIKTITEGGQRRIEAQSKIDNLQGQVDGKQVRLSAPVTTVAQISSDKGVLRYDRIDLTASFAKINASGTSEALNYTADVDFAKMQDELGGFINIPYKIAGQASSKGQVSMPKNKIITKGTAQYRDFRLTSPKGVTANIPAATANFSLTVDNEKSITIIESVDIDSTPAKMNIRDSVIPMGAKAKEPMKLDFVANYLDLAAIQPLLVIFADFPQQMQLAGTAQSKINVTSKNETYFFKVDQTRIQNLTVSYPEKEPFVQQEITLTADGQMNTVNKTYAVNWQMNSPQIKIQGNLANTVQGQQTKLDGKANLDYEWAALSTLAAPYLPQGLNIQGHRNDAVTFASTYPTAKPDQMFANLNADAKTGFAKAEYQGLNFGPTELAVNVQKGVMKIPPFSAPVNNGKVNFAGQADFNRKPTLLEIPSPMQVVENVQINDVVSARLLQYSNPIFAKALNVKGLANLQCDRLAIPLAGATKNDMVAIGTMALDQVSLQNADLLTKILGAMGQAGGTGGQLITVHPTKFALQNGYLAYDNMQMDVGNRPLNFQGRIGLDKSLDMTVVLPVTFEGRTATTETPVAQRVSAPLKGTLDNPQLDLGKLLQQNIQKQGEQILQEQLKKLLEGATKRK